MYFIRQKTSEKCYSVLVVSSLGLIVIIGAVSVGKKLNYINIYSYILVFSKLPAFLTYINFFLCVGK